MRSRKLWMGLFCNALLCSALSCATHRPSIEPRVAGEPLSEDPGTEIEASESLSWTTRTTYRLLPPLGWVEEPGKTVDMRFVSTDPSPGAGHFRDNLNVVKVDRFSVDDVMPLLCRELFQGLSARFSSYRQEQCYVGTLKGRKTIRTRFSYRELGYDVRAEQIILSGTTHAVVITCSVDQSRSEVLQTCIESAHTLVFLKPEIR